MGVTYDVSTHGAVKGQPIQVCCEEDRPCGSRYQDNGAVLSTMTPWQLFRSGIFPENWQHLEETLLCCVNCPRQSLEVLEKHDSVRQDPLRFLSTVDLNTSEVALVRNHKSRDLCPDLQILSLTVVGQRHRLRVWYLRKAYPLHLRLNVIGTVHQTKIEFRYLPAYRIWKTVGLSLLDWAYSIQILLTTECEHVPTPSLKTRLFLFTSSMLRTVPLGRLTELKVCENACPIRAAHFAGDRILLKSPSRDITALAVNSFVSRVNGAINQHVWVRSEEWENPRNYM